MVWTQVGAFVVVACAHCPRVSVDWTVQPGDLERIRHSAESHELRCVHLTRPAVA
jgi:hypothetical protein